MTLALYRRRVIEEPVSQLAVWARRIAVFAFVVVLLSIILARADLLETVPVVATFASALVLAGVGILFSLASFVMLWINGGPGFGQAMMALVIGAGLLGYPGYLGYKAYHLPALKDVTTDPIDPPRFEVVSRLRPANSNTYPGLATADHQKEAWPDIEPLQLSVPPRNAFDGAMAVIAKRKWRVVDARAPQGNREGHIEAIARTMVMGFRDDVVVRIRATRDGSKVDLRSASRYGYTDFGDNAERVLALLDDIDDASTVEKERPVRPAKPPPAPTPAPAGAKTPAQPAQGAKR